MKRAFSLSMIFLIVLPAFVVLTPKVQASENVIFQDDFESYSVGTFPSSGGWQIVWNGAGDAYQVITNAYYSSPTKSLQLKGAYGWSVVVKKDFSSSSNLIGYETRLMASEGGGGSVAFCNIPIETWGRYYAMVGFGTDGFIWACSRNNEGYQQLQPFTPYSWYKIRVLIDRSAKAYDVWIDDVLRGQDISIYYDPWEILSLQFQVGWVSIKNYFDNVKVFGVSGQPAPVISSVSTITATRLQTIHIYGSGFGDTPPQTVNLGDGSVDTVSSSTTPYMCISDSGKTEKTGDTSDGGENWAAGIISPGCYAMIGIVLVSWSDNEIVLGGFGTALGTNGQGTWYIEPGDPLSIDVFTPSGHADYHIRVAGGPVQDFSMHWSSPYYGVTAGGQTSFVIHLDYSLGFDGTVTLSFQGLPDGCTASFDIDVVGPPVSYRTLTVSTSSALSNGTYTFVVKGESGGLYQTIPITLTVGTGEISGVVYRDDNGNGLRDLGEPVVSGATIGYYATQNYVNLYVAGANSNSLGEFTLTNVPFNIYNEITATATGLTQRCIPINIMNQAETHVDIGIKPPTILYKPVMVDGCKYQLKLLHGSGGQVTGGFILNLTASKQPTYVDPADPAESNYATGITKRVIRAMLIQELASDSINIGALPYEQIFGQNPSLENWLSNAATSTTWYILMPLTGFSITPDTTLQWDMRLRTTIFDSIDDHTESLLNLHELEETPGLDPAVATRDQLLELPGFEAPSDDILFWNTLSDYYNNYGRDLYNVFVLKKLTSDELSYLDNIYLQSESAGVVAEVKDAVWQCYTARSNYASNLLSNIQDYAVNIVWQELLDPSMLVNKAIEAGITANLLPIGMMELGPFLLALKAATILLLNPQETYDNIRDAEAGRVVLKELEKIHESYLTLMKSASEVTESQTETMSMLMEMEYHIGASTAQLARSALGCSVIGQAMDNPLDPWGSSWRATMSYFENEENWAEGYAEFIDERVKNEVNQIAGKITIPTRALGFVLHSPATMLVFDPQDRCIGFDPGTENTINQIPTGVYSGPTIEPQLISIVAPLEGAYRVLLTGIGTGSCTLDSVLTTPTGTITESCTSSVEAGRTYVHYVFIPESGDSIAVDLNATVAFYYDTLNLKSKGEWITAYIELPEGYDVSNIDVSKIRLNETIPAELELVAVGDYATNGIPDLMVRFNRTLVIEYMISRGMTHGNATLTITGLTQAGKSPVAVAFKGSHDIRVSSLIGDVNCDGTVNIFDATLALQCYGSKEGSPNWNPNANLAEEWDRINLYDVITLIYHYGQTSP
jgi:hypothetical protein